ncbi:MAG: hypothetical protein ACOX19_01930 [Fermentimonas sp.]
MKKMIILLLLALGIVSCTNESSLEILGNPESEKAMSCPVKFNFGDGSGVSTRVETRGSLETLPTNANEKKINNLVVIAFNSLGKIEKVIKHTDITFNDPMDFYQGGMFDLGVEGSFQLEFVVNSDNAFQSSLQPGMPLDDFGALTVSGVPSHGDDGFVMTNAEPVNVATQIGVNKDVGNVTLRRLLARFDVFSNVEGLHIESITLKNQVSSSFIFTDNNIPVGSDAEELFTASPSTALWFTNTKAMAGIYSYENPVKGGTTLLLKGTYTKSTSKPEWEKEVVFLDASDNSMPIKRNHLYRVVVSESHEGSIGTELDVTFNIEVLDWDDAVTFEYSDSDIINEFTEYVFTATPSTFTAFGGTGLITGVKNVYKGDSNEGELLSSTDLIPSLFTIASKEDNPAGLTVNDGDKSFEVSSGYAANDYVIVATVNGTDYDITVQREGWDNPLSLVTEYNVNPAGNGFVTDLTGCRDVSGYFNFDDAVDQFSDITIGDKRYHLPSHAEWRSIVQGGSSRVNFTESNSFDNYEETVSVLGQDISFTSDFRTGVNGISYALRYKGTEMISAWKYEHISDGDNTHMKITSRNVYGQTGITVDNITNDEFWNNNAENDVSRYFPASGVWLEGEAQPVIVTNYGFFWSSTEANDTQGRMLVFGSANANIDTRLRSDGLSVRLFISGN